MWREEKDRLVAKVGDSVKPFLARKELTLFINCSQWRIEEEKQRWREQLMDPIPEKLPSQEIPLNCLEDAFMERPSKLKKYLKWRTGSEISWLFIHTSTIRKLI